MSFECPQCGWKNCEIQPAGQLGPCGKRVTLTLVDRQDLDRQIVKSEYATCTLVAMDFVIPPSTQRGVVTTIEGLIRNAATALQDGQKERMAIDSQLADKIQIVIQQLEKLCNGEEFPFDVMLDDPAGHSHIEPKNDDTGNDSRLVVEEYERSKAQLQEMGYFPAANTDESTKKDAIDMETTENDGIRTGVQAPKVGAYLPLERKAAGDSALCAISNLEKMGKTSNADKMGERSDLEKLQENGECVDASEPGDPVSFETPCSHCLSPGETNMVEIEIPGFRKCLLMAFVCDVCGARSNEVKAAGAYGELARKWTLSVTDVSDLSRDVLKSDMASVAVPELCFEAAAGTRGGVFTTIEGLLIELAQNLEEGNPFAIGDSSEENDKKLKLKEVTDGLREFSKGMNLPFTLVVDDMADHSYIGSRHPTFKVEETLRQTRMKNLDENDHNLVSEFYKRTHEQDDDLGILDMKTENY